MTGWEVLGCVVVRGVCWVEVKLWGVGLYSLSSSVGWKAGDFTASEVSLAFPFRSASASIFLLRREFSCLSASISSALRFFRFASSCCIFIWPSRMAAKLGVTREGPEGPASTCLLAPALLRVETIFREKRVQRENIFQSRCKINKWICSLIIDGGSSTNVAGTRLGEKLSLETIPHAKPYKLAWISKEGEIDVNKQVLINFSIGSVPAEGQIR